MLVASGALLVLVTWAVCLTACGVVGLPLAALTSTDSVGWSDLRRGMWWGLLVVTVAAYLANLVVPLASGWTTATLALFVLVGAVVSVRLVRNRGWRSGIHRRWSTLAVSIGGGMATVYLAVAALGRVTNYDSGLYHLSATRYAAEYATIPGLANLYFAFGYSNAEFPLAGLLQNGPWGPEGFRLLNGLVIAAVVVELVIRSALRHRDAGFYVLLVGAVVVLIPMVALSDYWVTSPSQDSAVFAVTVVASAYLTQGIAVVRSWVSEAATACGLGMLLVLLRPTMAVFLVVTLAVVPTLWWRRGLAASPAFGRASGIVIVVGGVAAIAATLRDYVLSGWLQYPLSFVAFDVPWRAANPVNDRIATLGYHRDPTDLWNADHGWAWVVPWLRRLPGQWETYLVVLLALLTVMAFAFATRSPVSVRGRSLLLAVAPSVIMTIFWFAATPPSFRFAWGPVFTCLTIPLGWSVWRLARLPQPRLGRCWANVAVLGCMVPVALVVVYSLFVRLQPGFDTSQREWRLGISVPYAVASVPEAPVHDVPLSGELIVRVPTAGEQCWAVFPLCTPLPDPKLSLRGDSLQSGFAPQ